MHSKRKIVKELLHYVKCVKCGAHHRLIPLNFNDILGVKRNKESRSLKSSNIVNTLVPVCTRCSLDFQRWKRFDTKYKRKMYKCTIYCSFTILLIFDIIISSLFGFILFCIIAGIWIFYNLKQWRKSKQMEFYPQNYIHYAKDGSISLKSNFSSRWIKLSEWLKEAVYERVYLLEAVDIPYVSYTKNDFVQCVYCGSKVLRSSITCFRCEKILPLV